MFLGHFAVGFAAKRAAPRASLTALLSAAMFLDLVWPLLLALGIERVRIVPGITAFNPLDFESYPFSHSLAFTLLWSALFAGLYRWRTRYAAGAWAVGLGVSSHWVLDLVTHRPDLPLAPGDSPRFGLGLWNSVAGTVALESALFVAGLALYLSATRARGWRGHVSLWTLLAFVLAIHVANVAGPPPPSVEVLRGVALAMYLFVPWFVWIDRTREARTPAAA